ncbi:hypothetical protein [Thermococcus henrietii]|uniref:hypothetical protein n=1 Tax=Thermococcus henrietii TaxID=2016361 RepID=UPI000C0716E0|nr:hypothetical protein [Thermococcus henrietii]
MRARWVFFVEGFLSVLHPWLAVVVLVLNWIIKPQMKYYSEKPASVQFLAGMPVGFVLGYGAFRGEYLQWWLDYRGDLLRIVAGSKPAWVLAVLAGLALWGLTKRRSEDEKDS